MENPPQVSGDDSFLFGCKSNQHASRLNPGEYVMAMNIINRGGIAQTRPGSRSLPFEVPGNNLQGITMFQPSSGPACLVFVSDGLVYASKAPFKTYFQIPWIKFSKYSKYVAFASCVQSTAYTDGGEFYVLDEPKSILIIQDGATRAAYWDGSESDHIVPTPSTVGASVLYTDGTPVGLWMCWSNNRLWVSRENMVFASDIGNPLKFSEAQYLNEGRAFYLPDKCTGIVETPDQAGIICFTGSTGTLIQSSIQDRSKWLQTPDFYRTVMTNLGCVAPRSITSQYGLIWWQSQRGLVNLDDASRLNISSRMNVQDQEMARSNSNLNDDRSGICGSFYENFLLQAVPVSDRYNSRIHVLDQAPSDDAPINSWASYWELWRPIEFARGLILGQERIFCLSADHDGKNRIWELFRPERDDNGIPITAYVETRTHLFDNRDLKKFRYGQVEALMLEGDVSFMIAVAGIRGAYQTVGQKEITSLKGQVYHDVLYGELDNPLLGSMTQTRTIRTENRPDPSDCNSACIESDDNGLIDRGFSLLIAWSGNASVSAYQIFVDPELRQYQGTCEESERGEINLLTAHGCGSEEEISNSSPFTRYYATATFTRINPDTGNPVTSTNGASSVISQDDANRKASALSRWKVLEQLGSVL